MKEIMKKHIKYIGLAIKTYKDSVGGTDRAVLIQDMLTDLMLYCKHNKIAFHAVLDRADRAYLDILDEIDLTRE